MMKSCFSTVLFLVLNVFSLSAMINCPAPAPASGAIVNEGETSIELRWEEVPGAMSYEVTTIDLSESGGTVLTSIIGGNEILQDDLETGKEYQFEIRASYCGGGPYGEDPLVLRAATTIVIVDVILQIDCDEDPEIIFSGSVSSGDHTNLEIPTDDEGCYLFEFSTQDLDPNVELEMVLTTNQQGGLTLNNLVSNINNFQLSGKRPVKGEIDDGFNKNILLLDADARKKKDNFQTVFNWYEDMELTISYCADCELIMPVPGRPDNTSTKEISAIKIYPNPIANLLQLQIPRKGFVEIWDLTGRRWFSTESDDYENIEIDSSNWPSGTYTLRWNDHNNNPPEIKLFLKL